MPPPMGCSLVGVYYKEERTRTRQGASKINNRFARWRVIRGKAGLWVVTVVSIAKLPLAMDGMSCHVMQVAQSGRLNGRFAGGGVAVYGN